MKRIMYIENKTDSLIGPGRIGWVETSRSKRSYTYGGKRFNKTTGYKYNCIEEESGALYWISGPKRRGGDALYGSTFDIDEDARIEYWTGVRGQPEFIHLKQSK
jgi:hypothetical protein